MDISADLLRVIWHEMGHLCVDIVETDNNQKYQVEDVWFYHHPRAISEYKWTGGVKSIPSIKFEMLIEDEHKTSFALIDLISGCIFQTIFYQHVQNYDIDINKCFGFCEGCAGRGDCSSFNEIGKVYRSRYGNRKDFSIFINKDLFDIYRSKVVANSNFLNALNAFTIIHRDIILDIYSRSLFKESFGYHFKGDSLISLIEELRKILKTTGFYDEIMEVKEIIYAKMILDKKNALPSD